MPVLVSVQLTTAGSGTGPFDLYTDLNLLTPFTSSIPRTSLLSGFEVTLPDGVTFVRVKSVGACTNYVDLYNTCVAPTATPTPPPTGPTATPTRTPTPTPTLIPTTTTTTQAGSTTTTQAGGPTTTTTQAEGPTTTITTICSGSQVPFCTDGSPQNACRCGAGYYDNIYTPNFINWYDNSGMCSSVPDSFYGNQINWYQVVNGVTINSGPCAPYLWKYHSSNPCSACQSSIYAALVYRDPVTGNFYTGDSMTTFAADGFYSDGTYVYQSVNGITVEGYLCSEVCAATTVPATTQSPTTVPATTQSPTTVPATTLSPTTTTIPFTELWKYNASSTCTSCQALTNTPAYRDPVTGNFYTNSSKTVTAPDGFYSDGTYVYQSVSGITIEGFLCSEVCTTTQAGTTTTQAGTTTTQSSVTTTTLNGRCWQADVEDGGGTTVSVGGVTVDVTTQWTLISSGGGFSYYAACIPLGVSVIKIGVFNVAQSILCSSLDNCLGITPATTTTTLTPTTSTTQAPAQFSLGDHPSDPSAACLDSSSSPTIRYAVPGTVILNVGTNLWVDSNLLVAVPDGYYASGGALVYQVTGGQITSTSGCPTTTTPPTTQAPIQLSLRYDSDSITSCSSPATTYYLSGGKLYQDAGLTTYAIDGYYSDGIAINQVSGGTYIEFVGAC